MEEQVDLGQLDCFGMYVYGLVLTAAREKAKARKYLIQAIRRFPYLWPAWKALLNCLPGPMAQFFKGTAVLNYFDLNPNFLTISRSD